MKDRQYWGQIEQWVKETEPPSEDIFLKMISKRLYDKRVYTGVSGKFSFVQSILSQSNNDFREQLAEDLEIIFSSPDSATLEVNIKLLKKVASIGKASEEVLRDAINRIFVANWAGSIDRGVNHYAALSIVAASKNSLIEHSEGKTKKKARIHTNWVHNQIHKILNGTNVNVRFFLIQLLQRMKEIEKKGALMFGGEDLNQNERRG